MASWEHDLGAESKNLPTKKALSDKNQTKSTGGGTWNPEDTGMYYLSGWVFGPKFSKKGPFSIDFPETWMGLSEDHQK